MVGVLCSQCDNAPGLLSDLYNCDTGAEGGGSRIVQLKAPQAGTSSVLARPHNWRPALSAVN